MIETTGHQLTKDTVTGHTFVQDGNYKGFRKRGNGNHNGRYQNKGQTKTSTSRRPGVDRSGRTIVPTKK